MDIARVKAAINGGSHAAEHASTGMHNVQDQTRQAEALATAIFHDSTHEEVKAGLDKLRASLKEARRVTELLKQAVEAINVYTAKF